MNPKTIWKINLMARCPYGGGHAVPATHIVTIDDPSGGAQVYAGCIECLVRGIGRIDSPGAVSMDAQARILLVRAIAALTTPMHYSEVGELVQQIRAMLGRTD